MDAVAGQGQNLNLKMSDTTPLKCDQCGCQKFTGAVILRRVSPLVSPSAQEAMVPINTYACLECNWVNKQFLPKDLPVEVVNAKIEEKDAK